MAHQIRCGDLGFECVQTLRGDTIEQVLEALMHHIEFEHDGDWFDLEVVYEAARESMRRTAA